MKIELSKQMQQILVAVVLGLGASGFAYWKYFWQPYSLKAAQLDKSIKEAEDKIASAKAIAAKLGDLQKKLDELRQQTAEAEKKLPKGKAVPDLLESLHDWARKHRIFVESLNPEGAKAQQYFIENPYQVTLQGSYHTVAYFLSALAISERIFNEKNLNLSPFSKSTDPSMTVRATFQLIAYQYNAQAETAPSGGKK